MYTPEKHQQTRWYPWGIQSPHTSTATGGGVFWVSSDLDSGKKVRVFHFLGGVFWVRPDLDSGNNFNFVGRGVEVFWNQIPEQGCFGEIWSKFSGSLAGWTLGTILIFGGRGVFWNQIPEQGCFGEIWSKFSGSLAGWCITDTYYICGD